jgi:hypothetical protein
MWSECITIYRINLCCPRGQYVSHWLPMWSECITICHINPNCSHGQYVSHWLPTRSLCIIVMLYQITMSIWSVCIPLIAHVVGVYNHMPYQSMPSTWSVCIPLIVHVVGVYHHMPYRSKLFTWSVCFSIYCPCGQSVSPYVVSIQTVHMVSMFQYILPMWSESHSMLYCHV